MLRQDLLQFAIPESPSFVTVKVGRNVQAIGCWKRAVWISRAVNISEHDEPAETVKWPQHNAALRMNRGSCEARVRQFPVQTRPIRRLSLTVWNWDLIDQP